MFWNKKSKLLKESVNLGALVTDMHSHLIPGIDDGAPNMETSLGLIEGLRSAGYRKLITTPHIMVDYYKNTRDIILSGRDMVREALETNGINLPFDAAAEYFTDSHFEELIKKKELLTFGNNYVLFEFGFIELPPMANRAIFEMQMAGYNPVLAHPERYSYLHNKLDTFHDLVEKGVMLQVNVNSLTGAYNDRVKKCAEQLIDQGLVSFIGTDCHHQAHINMLGDAVRQPALKKILDSGSLKNSIL